MFDRISSSFALARSSWQVLRENKHLLIFPVLSGICCLLVTASFLAPLLMNMDAVDRWADQSPWVFAIIGFAFYFCTYFVIIFFNAALISCALISFSGAKPTLGDGLSAAASRLPQIFAWALVSATVGMLLRAVEQAHEKAGEIISAILGTVWTVVTYFVVPVLVVERVGPIAAIKRSTSILKQTWGEALVGKFGLGLFLLLLSLPGILLLIGGFWLMSSATAPPAAGAAVAALGGLYLLVMMAVGGALQGIFVSALYQYAANGQTPEGFDGGTMREAFRAK